MKGFLAGLCSGRPRLEKLFEWSQKEREIKALEALRTLPTPRTDGGRSKGREIEALEGLRTDAKAADEEYCRACGAVIKKEAEICPKCGVRHKYPGTVSSDRPGKSWLTTLLLCVFLGYLGVHRFYTGHTSIGVVQLLTGGGCGIWWLIDFILILANSYKDADGNPLVK